MSITSAGVYSSERDVSELMGEPGNVGDQVDQARSYQKATLFSYDTSNWTRFVSAMKTSLYKTKMNCFPFESILNVMYSCDGKAELSAPLLQSSVSHDLSEITLKVKTHLSHKVFDATLKVLFNWLQCLFKHTVCS